MVLLPFEAGRAGGVLVHGIVSGRYMVLHGRPHPSASHWAIVSTRTDYVPDVLAGDVVGLAVAWLVVRVWPAHGRGKVLRSCAPEAESPPGS